MSGYFSNHRYFDSIRRLLFPSPLLFRLALLSFPPCGQTGGTVYCFFARDMASSFQWGPTSQIFLSGLHFLLGFVCMFVYLVPPPNFFRGLLLLSLHSTP